MKFETYIHKIVKNYQKIFHKDPCTHAHTRGVNVRARVLSQQNARAYVFPSCARAYVCMGLYEISVDNSLLSYEYNSQIS